jgi:HD-GYP domain-containing protein (c-di-GMP phosphodiesterase class II)
MTQSQEVKVRVFDLEIGMYVCRLDKDWTETSYPLQGFLIENDSQIQKLSDECEYVYVDIARKKSTPNPVATSGDDSLSIARKSQKKPEKVDKVTRLSSTQEQGSEKKPLFSLKGLFALLAWEEQNTDRKKTNQLNDIVSHKISTTKIQPPKKLASVTQEIGAAKRVHNQANMLLRKFMSAVKEGETINMIIAEQAVHNCILSALRSPDALLLVSHLYKKHLTIWEHSMRVSVLAINLGRYLNLSDDELTILGLCGMLHDIGALLISKEMLAESENKIELMQSHTILGRDILLSSTGGFSKIVAEVAYSHHEYLNGTGYPRGLKYNQISSYARIITIVDLYISLITDNLNGKILTHYEAVLILLENTNTRLDEVLVHSFIQCLGTYPVGCFVEMNTGEVGIVVEENQQQKLKPKIVLVTTHDKNPCPDRLIELANLKGKDILYEIRTIIHPDKYPALKLRDTPNSLSSTVV